MGRESPPSALWIRAQWMSLGPLGRQLAPHRRQSDRPGGRPKPCTDPPPLCFCQGPSLVMQNRRVAIPEHHDHPRGDTRTARALRVCMRPPGRWPSLGTGGAPHLAGFPPQLAIAGPNQPRPGNPLRLRASLGAVPPPITLWKRCFMWFCTCQWFRWCCCYENAAPHRAPHRAQPTPLAYPQIPPRYPTP